MILVFTLLCGFKKSIIIFSKELWPNETILNTSNLELSYIKYFYKIQIICTQWLN